MMKSMIGTYELIMILYLNKIKLTKKYKYQININMIGKLLIFFFIVSSSTRMHSAGCSGHGHSVPGQVWYGQDGRLRPGHAAAAGADREPCLCARHVPYARVGLPDLQRVRAFQQIHAGHQGWCVLRRYAHPEGRGAAQVCQSACGGWHSWSHPGSDQEQEAEPETPEALHPRRMRQDARAIG